MQNAAAVEALYSATFVEDYLDILENLPNDVQRQLSRLREHDLSLRRDFVSEMDAFLLDFDNDHCSVSAQKLALGRLQKALIQAQDIGDDKLASVQNIADLVEGKSRLLEQDARNLQFEDDEDDSDSNAPTRGNAKASSNGNDTGKTSNSGSNNNGWSGKAKAGKTARGDANKEDNIKPPPKRRKKQTAQADKSSSSLSGVTKDDRDDETSSTSSRTTKKRGTAAKRRQQQQQNKQANKGDDSDKEIDWSTLEIDPDEPTYCLCDQVSFGDMIGCDNDLCPIEWFHFSCVDLSSKPKGKWFCPRCRGDKPTVMKPKAQFLKELERYNREREEKLVKMAGNSN